VTNEFGETHLPYYLHHSGIDIASKKGDPITPFMPGKVTYAGEIFWGFGKHVIVDHGDNITSVYGHLSKISTKKGDDVKPGDVIGLEGSTGWSTGTHLHFQINVFGIPVNPRVFLQN
jgi:murein DD-endopeptidase MepM/ murein hydrolase activator NlpD